MPCAPCPLSPGAVRLAHGRPPGGLWALPEWRAGCFEVQDSGSQLIALAVGAAPGERVLDLCAGNGGKALAVACGAMRGVGSVLGYDVDPSRLRQMVAAARRAGCDGAVAAVDGEAALNALPADFDAVLVDAPCSSTGALRRRPGLRWALSEAEATEALPRLQRQLIARAAAKARRPGGRVVYATCSVLPCENGAFVGGDFEHSTTALAAFVCLAQK